MRVFFDQRQTGHAPVRELNNGEWTPYAETPQRALAIAAALDDCEPPADFGLTPIAAVHDGAYLALLRQGHDEWIAAGRAGDAVAYTFPIVERRRLNLQRIDARIGAHSLDAATPLAAGTWDAAYWSAQCALSATDAVVLGAPRAFALCRPPGHHAGHNYMGGYCYLNNAAIAAGHAAANGLGPVAILDIDYHHGNGTQDLFYDRGDLFFCSIHADPATDYPFFWGHADETGRGEGTGTTLNIVLPRGTAGDGYFPALDRAVDAIARWGARCLIVSFGADTHASDPISHFRLTRDDFGEIGRRIRAAGLPTIIVMEGGYAVAELGVNVAGFVSGVDD